MANDVVRMDLCTGDFWSRPDPATTTTRGWDPVPPFEELEEAAGIIKPPGWPGSSEGYASVALWRNGHNEPINSKVRWW